MVNFEKETKDAFAKLETSLIAYNKQCMRSIEAKIEVTNSDTLKKIEGVK